MSSLPAQAPTINSLSVPNTVREMGVKFASASASDPNGDPLTYTWSFEDPTGQAYYFEATAAAYTKTLSGSRTFVVFGIGDPGEGPAGPTSLQGQQFTVKLAVSDGSNTTVATRLVTVNGFNEKPIITLKTEGMGTQSQPKVSPGALSLTASTSYDPDGGVVRFAWKLGGYFGGFICPGGVLVLFGKETDRPSLPIPKVSATPNSPMNFRFNYRVIDGMYVLTGGATGFAASPNGCNTDTGGGDGGDDNPPPKVQVFASSTQATGGAQVTMAATINDPGDTHTKSWLQINNTTPVTLSSPDTTTTSFTAPDQDVSLRFRFIATDSAQQSDSADIIIQVNGGSSGDGGTGDGQGSGSGTSTGSNTGCSGLNLPAVATVPAAYTITEGLFGKVEASEASDPDNTPGAPINGLPGPPVVNFLWSVTSGQGVMDNNSLQGSTTSAVGFTAPEVDEDTTFGLALTVTDVRGCGSTYPVDLVVQNEIVNNAPTIVLTYEVQGQGVSGQAPAGGVSVVSPAEILLDASGSSDPDGDAISVAWQSEGDLTGGSSVLSQDGATATLTVTAETYGSATVTVTVADDRGGEDSQSLEFYFVEPEETLPVAAAGAMQDGAPLNGPVGNGDEVSLDAGASTLPDGTQEEIDNLVFAWRQIGGTRVFSRDFDKKKASILIQDITEEETLTFELKVRNGEAEDTATVELQVDPGTNEDEYSGEIHYPIVGMGSLGDGSSLQTTLIIDNLLDEAVEDVQIFFYDTVGGPLEVAHVDVLDPGNPIKSWDSSQPFTLAARSSRVLEFVVPEETAPQGEAGVRSGWAWVSSSGRLRGSIRYQLIQEEDGGLIEDVGIPTDRPGRDFQTAFRLKDEFAFAIANPGDSEVVIELSVYYVTDPTVPAERGEVILGAGEMRGIFLDEIFSELDVEEGHLWIRSQGGEDFALSGLVTEKGFFISAQSLSRIR